MRAENRASFYSVTTAKLWPTPGEQFGGGGGGRFGLTVSEASISSFVSEELPPGRHEAE